MMRLPSMEQSAQTRRARSARKVLPGSPTISRRARTRLVLIRRPAGSACVENTRRRGCAPPSTSTCSSEHALPRAHRRVALSAQENSTVERFRREVVIAFHPDRVRSLRQHLPIQIALSIPRLVLPDNPGPRHTGPVLIAVTRSGTVDPSSGGTLRGPDDCTGGGAGPASPTSPRGACFPSEGP